MFHRFTHPHGIHWFKSLRRGHALILCLAGLLLLVVGPSPALSADPIRITFLCPSTEKAHPFWSKFNAFMAAAADDLDIRLDIERAPNRFETLDTARMVLSSANKPDYLVFVYHKATGREILKLAEQAKVHSFIVNADIIMAEQALTGVPRENFRYWLGHMYPDDENAGYLLARALIASAREKKLQATDGRFKLLAISGARDSSVSEDRNRGLIAAIQEAGDVDLEQLVFACWRDELAGSKTTHLLERYPEASIVWAASDRMAYGAYRAVQAAGVSPGKEPVFGGIDWSPQGIAALEDGIFAASVGGHFMEGAWALVLLHDYHRGYDFLDRGTKWHSSMHLLNARNKKHATKLLAEQHWQAMDFRRFTRAIPDAPPYDFTQQAVLHAMGD